MSQPRTPRAPRAMSDGDFDIVVVGAGHAGCEAAASCARLGLSTALVSVRLEDTARMSCNPAIGGIAKGHMVREIDALGGIMGSITDRAGIQFKVLNRGRGPAVWSPRAQCDKRLYSAEMIRCLAAVPGLERVTGVVNQVRLERGRVAGLDLADGRRLRCRAAILAPGTFLNGLIHIGPRKLAGGRLGEPSAHALSECLGGLGLERGRLKTGTPPRLHRDSIDLDALVAQAGDDPPQPFSHWTERLVGEQVLCWLTRTNERTHRLIRDHLHLSPLYSGEIRGTGPRYCPSIEDKVVKFPDRPSHQIFLEPEGRDVPEIYVNGLSSSMPEEIQLRFVRTLLGLEHAEMIRPGYAIEYDFVLPHQLEPTLEVKSVPGLFLAGQICGTSGYEEAAAQGLVAGLNAALQVRGGRSFVLRRDQAYIGVLVDDLVSREHREPYRMFTSAAEFRLLLRADNADERLAGIGFDLGLISRDQRERVRAKYAAIEAEERRLARIVVTVPESAVARSTAQDSVTGVTWGRATTGPADAAVESCVTGGTDAAIVASDAPLGATEDSPVEPATVGARRVSAIEFLSRPGSSCSALHALGATVRLAAEPARCLEVRVRYRGYIERQQRTAARAAGLEDVVLADALWEDELVGVSREAREKLQRWRPTTVGRASRIAGVSPSDVAILLVHARRVAAKHPG